MAKGSKPKARTQTFEKKTKTPKQRRSGIYAKAHHSCPVIRLQTPYRLGRPFEGITVMRAAFEAAMVPGVHAPRIARALRSLRGTWKTSGWKVIRGE